MRNLTTIVFIHRHDGWVPAGRLAMVEDGRNSHAVFDYGTRYVRRPDRVSVDPTTLPLPVEGTRPAPFRTEPGFALFNGLRDAAPDGWGRYLMDKAAGAQALEEYDYLLASGDNRIG
ncbi:MAG: HipA N-terminal domain-containing protein, partial [Brevundimonas sp.]|nr:HipA N-terminal domain-containing protein [Brevundimonas sp.]